MDVSTKSTIRFANKGLRGTPVGKPNGVTTPNFNFFSHKNYNFPMFFQENKFTFQCIWIRRFFRKIIFFHQLFHLKPYPVPSMAILSTHITITFSLGQCNLTKQTLFQLQEVNDQEFVLVVSKLRLDVLAFSPKINNQSLKLQTSIEIS